MAGGSAFTLSRWTRRGGKVVPLDYHELPDLILYLRSFDEDTVPDALEAVSDTTNPIPIEESMMFG